MNTITVTYLIRKPGNVIEMLIRGEELLLTRNGKKLAKIVPIKEKEENEREKHHSVSQKGS